MFLIKSLKKTIETIRRNKWLFLLLFVTQIAFLIVFSFVQVKYQMDIINNLNDVIIPLQEANYNETLIQQGIPFMENTFQVVEAWNQFKANLANLLAVSFLVFVIFNGLNWSLSHYVIKKQNFLKLWGKFAVFAGLFYFVFLLAGYFIFSSSLFFDDPVNAARIMIGLGVVLFYFGLLCFSSINFSFKEAFKKVFWRLGIKKFYWVLLVYFLVIVLLAIFLFLFYLSVNYLHFFLVMLLGVLMVLTTIFSRIFMIYCFSEIN